MAGPCGESCGGEQSPCQPQDPVAALPRWGTPQLAHATGLLMLTCGGALRDGGGGAPFPSPGSSQGITAQLSVPPAPARYCCGM